MTRTKSLRIIVFIGLFSLLFAATFLTERSFLSSPGTVTNNSPATPTSAAAPVDAPFTGNGTPQEVRINNSMIGSSLNTNGSFPIDSPSPIGNPSAPAYLTNASINYTFPATITTLYQVTPYSAIDFPRVLNGSYLTFGRFKDAIIPSQVSANSTVGNVANYDWAHDNSYTTFSNYTSTGTNQIRFEVYSDFSNLFIEDWVFPGSGPLWFTRDLAMSLRLNFSANVDRSIPAVNYIVEAQDFETPAYRPVGSGTVSNVTSTFSTLIVNPGAQYINATNGTHFRVTLTFSGQFNLTLYECNATITAVKELPVSNSNQVALGFDLLGNATVNGFQLLIRTIGDPTGVRLEAGLYRANMTFPSEAAWTTYPVAHPVGGPLATLQTPLGSTHNGIIMFNFSTPVSCNLGNYFIVLNTTSSTVVYSIATVPDDAGTKHGPSGYPNFIDVEPDSNYVNKRVRHVLLNSSTGFGEDFWNQSRLDISLSPGNYRLNAAPFAINVTRGWMPSDANMTLQGTNLFSLNRDQSLLGLPSIVDRNYAVAHEFPFNGTPGWYWGRGFYGLSPDPNGLNSPIKNNGWRFDVPLAWDQTQIQTLLFNTTFQAGAYAIVGVPPIFNVTATTNPRWITNITIANNTYPNWTFNALEFVFPKTWEEESIQLLNPDFTSINTFEVNPLNDTRNLLIARNTTAIKGLFGLYSFQINSVNAIKGFQSFLNWNNTNNWSTAAFMQGDNVSVEFTTQIGGIPVLNGLANTSLFAPGGARVSPSSWTLETSVFDQIISGQTYYRFGGVNLFNSTGFPRGQYTAISRWSNGTEIGFNRTNLYVTNYTPQISRVDFNPEFGFNFVEGTAGQDVNRSNSFDLAITTVNETTGLPRNFLPIPNMTQGFTTEAQGNTFPYFHLDRVNINETVFQRGETFEVNVSVTCLSAVNDIDIKVKVNMFFNSTPDWQIFEQTTDTITLHEFGADGDSTTFNMTGIFPGIGAQGLNCPMRKGPISMKLSFFVYGQPMGTWQAPSPFIQVDGNDSTFEGQILTTNLLQDLNSVTFICPIDRTFGVNLPGVTHYFVNIMDASGVSTEVNSSKVVYGQAQSIFTNFAPTPVIPTVNRLFNLSGNLTSENTKLVLSGKQVKFEYFNGISWNYLTGTDSLATVSTNADGFFTKEFNASIFGLTNTIRVSFTGDAQQLNGSLNYTLVVNQYNHDIQVQVDPKLQLSGNRENYVVFTFYNAGNSTLENLEISVATAENYTMQIVEADYVAEMSLAPGNSLTRAYSMKIPPLTASANATFTFTITATAKETLQSISLQETLKVEVGQGTLLTLSLEALPAVLFWLGVIVVWIGCVVFFMRKRQAIKKAEPSVPKRRFVKVPPAPVPTTPTPPPEKVTEIPQETKPAPQKPAAKDFDEILEEVKKDEDEDSSE